MLDIALIGLFPLFMILAALSDLMTMKISNHLVLIMAGAFGVVALFAGLPVQDVLQHLLAGFVVLLVGFAMFAAGWIGGGDAKFAAATAMWLGFSVLTPFIFHAALFGGGLTLIIIAMRRLPLPAPLTEVEWIDRLHDAGNGVPYGIALAAAGLIVYTRTPLFLGMAV